MKKVYSEKLVARSSPGRKYYDMILSAPRGGLCPICGERLVRTLDHYLPKMIYFTLVVTPYNLVPVCRDCNFDKHTYDIYQPSDAPLHPYFDNISNDVWLTVRLLPNQTLVYEVQCPENWPDVLKTRTKNHLNIYGLDEFFASKAAQEIADEISCWRIIFKTSGEGELLDHLGLRKISIERNGLNSWRAALYRGLVNQLAQVIEWL